MLWGRWRFEGRGVRSINTPFGDSGTRRNLRVCVDYCTSSENDGGQSKTTSSLDAKSSDHSIVYTTVVLDRNEVKFPKLSSLVYLDIAANFGPHEAVIQNFKRRVCPKDSASCEPNWKAINQSGPGGCKLPRRQTICFDLQSTSASNSWTTLARARMLGSIQTTGTSELTLT